MVVFAANTAPKLMPFGVDKAKLSEVLPAEKLHKIKADIKQLRRDETAQVIVKVKENTQLNFKKSRDNKLFYLKVKGNEIEELAKNDDILEIWPDLQTEAFLADSPYIIKADTLWPALNGSNIKIAILDTGIDTNHEMFTGRITATQDFTGTNIEDGYGHGTHVAGIAAGNAQYKGIAYDAQLYIGKVLTDDGYGSLSWLIDGIDWAISQEVDIISLSLGATYSGSAEDQLTSPEVLKIEEAINHGITVIIASGNCNAGACGSFTSVTTPGIARNAITIGAVDKNNNWASFSSGATIDDYIKPDLAAPGVSITSSIPNGYNSKTGTSMATPHVAGAAALLIQDDNTLTPLEIKSILETNSIDRGDTGKDTKYGSGTLNLEGILEVEPFTNYTGANYQLSIPIFKTGEENTITLTYYNQNTTAQYTSEFKLEELDTEFTSTETKTIDENGEAQFTFTTTLEMPGKHHMTIKVYRNAQLKEEINAFISAETLQITNMITEIEVVEG